MWNADKLYYNGESGFIAAYVGNTLVWKLIEGGIKLFISSIDEGKTAVWNGQNLFVGWNTLDLATLPMTSAFYPYLSSIKNAVISEVSFEGFSNDKLKDISEFLWNDSLRKYINLDKLILTNSVFTTVTRLCFSTNSITNNSDILNIGTIEGTNIYLPNCESLTHCFKNLKCSNFNLSVIEAPSLISCEYMFANAQIEKAPRFIDSKIINMNHMFDGSSVKEIPIMDCENTIYTNSAFKNCTELTTVGGFIGLKKSVSFNSSPLTAESVENIGNTIGEVKSAAIGFSQHTGNLLTDELRALFTNKGWVITIS